MTTLAGDFANVIASLFGLGAAAASLAVDNLHPFEESEYSGKFIAAKATGISGDTFGALASGRQLYGYYQYRQRAIARLREAYHADRLEQQLDDERQDALKYEASPILIALSVVQGLEMLVGFGQPIDGSDFEIGSERFSVLAERLTAIFPKSRWEGTASEAYANENAELQHGAETMSGVDTELTDILNRQADWVENFRMAFGIDKDLLSLAHVLEVILKGSGRLGTAYIFACICAGLGVVAANAFLASLGVIADSHACEADNLTRKYLSVADGADRSGAQVRSAAAATEASVVSSFEATSAGSFSMTAAPEQAETANSRGRQLAAASAITSAKDAADAVAPAESPVPGMSAVPLTVPTLTQVTQWYGQAAKASAQASQYASMGSQAAGQVQQVVSVAQQAQHSQPTEKPDNEPAPDGDPSADGAGSGAQAADGVPAGLTTADAAQQQAPSSY